jgi:hypothetical protein
MIDKDMEFVTNTKSMNMQPQSPDDFNLMDGFENKPMKLLPVMTGEQFQKIVCYPIIVEAWDKKKDGRRKRQWLKDFSKYERKKIGSYYGRFYKWYLVSGTPKHVACKLDTIELLQRAVGFFASI